MAARVSGTPLVISEKAKARPLLPIDRQGKEFSEGWLQELLFEHPELLPMHEFEEVFVGARAVGREVPTDAGPIDILYVNERGWIVLVETKLWRNPQARREVVAQIVNYASAMSRWSCEDLEKALRKSLSSRVKGRLVDLFKDEHEAFDENRFHDALSRNLRLGRFLLLVVGDGIHEGVEQMADFLQRTPQLQFNLGLVELGLYRQDSAQKWPIYVQPRLLARTREIVRAVVTVNIQGGNASVDVATPAPSVKQTRSRQKLSQEEYIEQLKLRTDEETANCAADLLATAEERNLTVRWQDTGPVFRYVDPDKGYEFTLGYLTKEGCLTGTSWLNYWLNKAGLPDDAAPAHKERIAAIVPGAEVKQLPGKKSRENKMTEISYAGRFGLPLKLLLQEDRKAKLFEAFDHTVTVLQRQLEEQG